MLFPLPCWWCVVKIFPVIKWELLFHSLQNLVEIPPSHSSDQIMLGRDFVENCLFLLLFFQNLWCVLYEKLRATLAHVNFIIKSEVSTFPIVIIFFCGHVSEMFVTSYSVTYCIYILGKVGFCFHHYCAVCDECKYSDTLWSADCIHLLVHYTISLSSLCKFICRL